MIVFNFVKAVANSTCRSTRLYKRTCNFFIACKIGKIPANIGGKYKHAELRFAHRCIQVGIVSERYGQFARTQPLAVIVNKSVDLAGGYNAYLDL